MAATAAEALGKIGDARAIAPLIGKLPSSLEFERKAAAEALVTLYKSGRLDEEQERLVLAQWPVITQNQVD